MTTITILALVIAGPLVVGLFLALVLSRLGREIEHDRGHGFSMPEEDEGENNDYPAIPSDRTNLPE